MAMDLRVRLNLGSWGWLLDLGNGKLGRGSGVQAQKVALDLSQYFDDPFNHASAYWPDVSTLLPTVLLLIRSIVVKNLEKFYSSVFAI